MKKTLKIVAFLLCFCVIFFCLQEIFINSMNEGTTKNSGFYDLPDNSVDVLFLGSSQMFCSINAQKLTEEYGISAFDFGSSSEPLPTAYYYLQEALKYQTPKVVGVEVVKYFDREIDYIKIARSYLTMPLSREKYESLKAILDGNQKEAAQYCFAPLLAYHSLWNQINPVKTALSLVVPYAKTDRSLRGFLEHDHIQPSEIAYLKDGEDECVTPNDKGIKAISDIADLCEEKGIKLFFFKAPSNVWTKSHSKIVKEFMAENGLTYFEMNDYLDEIGIDGNTDFYDDGHLNTTGANKTTDFMEKYLAEHYYEEL